MRRPRPWLVGSLAFFGALGSCPAAARASFPGRDGRIGFEAIAGGGFYSVVPDGTDQRQELTDAEMAHWSADGTRLIYASYANDGFGLWVAGAGDQAPTPFFNAGDHPIATAHEGYSTTSPAWAPDGKRVVFGAAWSVDNPADPELPLRRTAICVTQTHGRGFRQLHPGGEDPTWSPTGRRIAFVVPRQHDNRDGIATMRPDGRGVRTLLPARTASSRRQLDFSPNGRRLVFIQTGLGPNAVPSIRILDLARGRVTGVPGLRRTRVDGVAWAPDGKRLVYLRSDRAAAGQGIARSSVESIRPSGRGHKRLFTLPYDPYWGELASAVTWQPLP